MTTIICLDTPNVAMNLTRKLNIAKELKSLLIYVATQNPKSPTYITIPYVNEGTKKQKHDLIKTTNEILHEIQESMRKRNLNLIKEQLFTTFKTTTEIGIPLLRLTTPTLQRKIANLTKHTKILNQDLARIYKELKKRIAIHDNILKYVLTPVKANINKITNTNITIWLITYDKEAKRSLKEAEQPLKKILKETLQKELDIKLYNLPS